MAQNNIKTILSVDDKDVKSKLEGLKKYYSDTFKSWTTSLSETKEATLELSMAQQRLTKARYEMAAATAQSGTASKEELKSLRAEITAARDAVSAAKQRVSASKESTAAMWAEMEASKKAQSVLSDGTRKVDEHSKSLEQNWNQLIRVARWAGTLIGVYYGLSRAWDLTIGKGIELGRQIEDMTLGITALTASSASNIDSNGKVLNSMEKFRLASVLTTDTMQKLRKVATETPGTFTELTAIFQQAYTSTSKMGQGFGLTIKEITDNTVDLAGRIANIAGSIGMPMNKALEEARSLMSGQATGDSLIASLLFGSPAQANEAMRKAKEAGPLGVKKLIDEVTSGFTPVAQIDTYTKSMNNAVGAYENLVVAVSKPIKDDMAKFFDGVSKALTPDRIQQIAEDFKSVGNAIGRVVDVTEAAVLAFIAFKGVILTAEMSRYAGALFTAATATDTLTAATNRNAIAMRSHPAFKIGAVITSIASAQQDMVDESKGKWKITSKRQEIELTKQLTEEMAKLDDMQSKLGKQSKYNPFKVTPEDIKNQKEVTTNLINSITAYNTVTKPKTKPDGKGALQQEATDANVLADAMKHIEQTDTIVAKNADTRKKDLAQIAILEGNIARIQKGVSANTPEGLREIAKFQGQIGIFKKDITRLDAEDAKYRDSQASKAETARNKENRAELSRLEMIKASQAAEMRGLELIEAKKLVDYKLDESSLTDKERLTLKHYEILREEYRKNIIADQGITDEKNRQYKIDQDTEKLRQNEIDRLKFINTIHIKNTAELAKQGDLQAKALEKAYEDGIKVRLLADQRSKESNAFEQLFGKSKISIQTADAMLKREEIQFKWVSQALSGDELDKAEQKYLETVEKIKNKVAEVPPIKVDFELKGWDSFSNAIADTVNNFKALNKQTQDYNVKIKSTNLSAQERKDLDAEYIHNQIDGYGALIGAMSGFYDAQSSEAKRMHEVQKALSVAQMAIELSKSVVLADNALLFSLQAPPPANFAAFAATSAIIASLGIMLGVGGRGMSVSGDTFAMAKVNEGKGTVLGDASKQTESIANSLSLLSDLAKPEFRLISQMNESLKSIDSKISGLSANILQTAGFKVGEGFTNYTKTPSTTSEVLKTGALTGYIGVGARVLANLTKDIPLIGNLTGAIDKALGGLVSGIFGGETKVSLKDAGITFADQLITSAITGLKGQSYQIIKAVTDGGWFSSDKTKLTSKFQELDAYTNNQFQLVIKNLYDATIMSGESMGVASETIKQDMSDFYLSLGKISLKGKTGDEIQTELKSVFGKVGDNLVKEAYGLGSDFVSSLVAPVRKAKESDAKFAKRESEYQAKLSKEYQDFLDKRATSLDAFQQVGEGLFETMTRVSAGMSEADFYTKKLGISISKIGFSDIIDKQGNVAMEALGQNIKALDEASNGANNGVVKLLDTFTGSASELYDTYVTLDKVRQQLTAISNNGSALGSDMIAGAGGVTALSDAVSSFIDNFMTEQEKLDFKKNSLALEFHKIGQEMPTTAEGFKALVQGIDTTTASGQELYGRVILLSSAMADLFSTTTSATGGVTSVVKSLSALRAIEQLNITDSIEKARKNMVYAQEDIASILGKLGLQAGSVTASNFNTEYEKAFVGGLSEEQNQYWVDLSNALVNAKSVEEGYLSSVKSVADGIKNVISNYGSIFKQIDTALEKPSASMAEVMKQLSSLTMDNASEFITKLQTARDSEIEGLNKQLATAQKYQDVFAQIDTALERPSVSMAQVMSQMTSLTVDNASDLLNKLKTARDAEIQMAQTLHDNQVKNYQTQLDALNTQKSALEAMANSAESLLATAKSLRDTLIKSDPTATVNKYKSLYAQISAAISSGTDYSALVGDFGTYTQQYADNIKAQARTSSEFIFGTAKLATEVEALVGKDTSTATLSTVNSSIKSVEDAIKNLGDVNTSVITASFERYAMMIRSALESNPLAQSNAIDNLNSSIEAVGTEFKIDLGEVKTLLDTQLTTYIDETIASNSQYFGDDSSLITTLISIRDNTALIGDISTVNTSTSTIPEVNPQLEYDISKYMGAYGVDYVTAKARVTSLQGYATGGYTGDGNQYDIAGVVHKKEYVVNAKTTSDLGLNQGNGGVFKDILAGINETKEIMVKLLTVNGTQNQTLKAIYAK